MFFAISSAISLLIIGSTITSIMKKHRGKPVASINLPPPLPKVNPLHPTQEPPMQQPCNVEPTTAFELGHSSGAVYNSAQLAKPLMRNADDVIEPQVMPVVNELQAQWQRLWPAQIHKNEAQIKRWDNFSEIDGYDSVTREFKAGVYTTSVSCCSCSDFKKRNLPCRHMYGVQHFLNYVTNIVDIHNTFPPDASKWGQWNSVLHQHYEQKRRQYNAKTVEVISVDYKSKIGIINGYNVALSYCECLDFQRRRLPCKHIYRLKVELNDIDNSIRN